MSIVGVPGDPSVVAHECALLRVHRPVDALPDHQLPHLVVEKNEDGVGDGGDEEVRDRDGTSRDRDLHEWHVDQEEAEEELEHEGQVRPLVPQTVLRERQISRSADNVVGDLKDNSCDEEGGLRVEESLRRVAYLLASVRRDPIELGDRVVIGRPPAPHVAVARETSVEEADVLARLIGETPLDSARHLWVPEVGVAEVRQVGVVDVGGLRVEAFSQIQEESRRRPDAVVVHHLEVGVHAATGLNDTNLQIGEGEKLTCHKMI